MSTSELKIASESIKQLRGGLIVSCQAAKGEPLCAPEHIGALALSAIAGGARALRLAGAHDIAYVKARVSVPIVGLTKSDDVPEKDRLSTVYITPTFENAASIAHAGCDIIALDATARPRPGGITVSTLIKKIHEELKRPVWADVATLEEGRAAFEAGADIVSTTLSGYTTETAGQNDGPDFVLLETMCKGLPLPVVLEGKVWYPREVTQAFKLGAYAVVVGSAITRPQLITNRFVQAIPDKD